MKRAISNGCPFFVAKVVRQKFITNCEKDGSGSPHPGYPIQIKFAYKNALTECCQLFARSGLQANSLVQ